MITLACWLFIHSVPLYAQEQTQTIEQVFTQLTAKSFDDKSIAITALANSGHPATEKILNTILQGDLYYVKKTKAIVVVEKKDGEYQLYDALTNDDLGQVSNRKVKKISINNKILFIRFLVFLKLLTTFWGCGVRALIWKRELSTLHKTN